MIKWQAARSGKQNIAEGSMHLALLKKLKKINGRR